jgi:Ca2+-binding RTX toxin-like protein
MKTSTLLLMLILGTAGLSAGTVADADPETAEGAGTEDVTCFGVLGTVGTPGSDQLFGTLGDDVLSGIGGHDSLHGRAGNDRACGGDGHDWLQGGAGDDRIAGGMGADWLEGGRGSNFLLGGPGGDRLFGSYRDPDVNKGGPGDDYIEPRGSLEGQVVRGGRGEDVCRVDPNSDVRGCESFS